MPRAGPGVLIANAPARPLCSGMTAMNQTVVEPLDAVGGFVQAFENAQAHAGQAGGSFCRLRAIRCNAPSFLN